MAIPKNNTSAEERKDFTRTGDLSPASDETRMNDEEQPETNEVAYNAEEVEEDETLEDDLEEDDLEDADEDVDEDVDEDIS
jgi:hypothetical protein